MKKLLCILLALVTLLSMTLSVCAQSNDKTDILVGDTSLDGVVSIMDAALIQRYLAYIEELSLLAVLHADANANGKVDILDASLIQKFLAQIIDTLPYPPVVEPTTPPTEQPTQIPTDKPTDSPTEQPTQAPTYNPTEDASLQSYAASLNSVQSENTLTLTVFSDMHFDEYDKFSAVKEQKIDELHRLSQMTNIDYVANLGDFVIGNVDKATTMSSLNKLLTLTDNAVDCPLLNVRGNHDDNGWYSFGGYGGTYKQDEIINDKEWCELALPAASDKLCIDPANPYGGYGYIDDEQTKIRIFMLNSCDIPYILNDDGTYRYSSYTGHAFSNAQLNFVADSLMFSDKEDPNAWAAMFLTHVPIDTSNADNERFGGMSALIRGYDYMLSIIDAYRKGTSFAMSDSVYNPQYPNDRAEDFKVSVDINYSQKGHGEVIAFFSGHTHSNNYSNAVGIKNSLSYGYTFIGTVGSEAFTSYVIDRESCTISAFTYGPVYPEKIVGNIKTPPLTGSIESGVWSLRYDQFLPQGKNLYTGLSDVHPIYYNFDPTLTTAIDLDTLEIDGSVETKAARRITKAIAVRPFTTYILPKDFKGECLSFNAQGSRRAFLRITEHENYKTFTTQARTGYVAFSLDTGIYTNYKNFSIKEQCYGVNY